MTTKLTKPADDKVREILKLLIERLGHIQADMLHVDMGRAEELAFLIQSVLKIIAK